MEFKKYAIIVAGGIGSRMQSNLPKQFLCIGGRPILMHTITAFHRYDPLMQIIVVLSEAMIPYWEELCEQYSFAFPHQVVVGGVTRFHSVKNGLSVVELPAMVAVHDGVRPFASPDLIQRCFERAYETGTAIPVLATTDSLRKILPHGASMAIDRSQYKIVQTPQVFDGALLLQSYNTLYMEYFTDDASVVETNGTTLSLVEGESENIKITTPIDKIIAEALLKEYYARLK